MSEWVDFSRLNPDGMTHMDPVSVRPDEVVAVEPWIDDPVIQRRAGSLLTMRGGAQVVVYEHITVVRERLGINR